MADYKRGDVLPGPGSDLGLQIVDLFVQDLKLAKESGAQTSDLGREIMDVLMRGLNTAKARFEAEGPGTRGKVCMGWYIDGHPPTSCMLWYSDPQQ